MELEKVTIKFARKKNLGDYESVDSSCMLTAIIQPEDDKDAVMRGLWTMAKENVKQALAPYIPALTTQEFFLGLPVEKSTKETL